MDRKSIRLIFLSDPDLKFVLGGVIFGIFSYFVGGFNGLLTFLFIATIFLSFLKIEIALLSLPLFVLLDFFVKNYTFGFFGLWDEAIFLFLLLIILYRMQKEKRFTFKFTNLIYPVLAFLIAGLLSIYFSKDVNLTQGIEGIRSVIQSFIFFFIVVNTKISKRASRFLLFVGIFACAISALFGIYQYIVGVAVPPNWLDKDTEVGLGTRAFSFLGSPNAFAGYSVLFAPICLGFAFKKKLNLSQKALVMLFFFTIIGGLTSTLTRAAWLAFIPSLVLFGILIKQTKIILPVVLVLIAVVFSVAPMQQRFMNLFSEQYQTKSEIGGRNYRWSLALRIFEENPIFGRGPGSYGGATAYRFQEFSGLYVDNYYFEILSNYGFVGFLVFLWLIFEIIRTVLISINEALDDDKYILYGILCGIIGFLINNFTENLWEVIPLSVSMWFVLGIAVNLSSGGDGNG